MSLLPGFPFAPGARVIVLEAQPGRARREHMEAWTRAAEAAGAAAWLLPCDVERGGLWAGVGEWIEALLPMLEARAPDLFTAHDAELTSVLPLLRRRVRPRFVNLTDAASKDEAVRNYAADRAYRTGQGLIDLLDAWHTRTGGGRWVVACDDFDQRGAVVGEFFGHLVRRRGDKLGLVLVTAVAPGEGDCVEAEFAPFAPVSRVRLEVEPGPVEALAPEEAARMAVELEPAAMHDNLTVRAYGHEMIRLWTAAGRPDRAADWHALVLGFLVKLGFYRDALRHAPPVHANLHLFDQAGSSFGRVGVVNKLHVAYVTNGREEDALDLLLTEGLGRVAAPASRARFLYHVAMLHARFLRERDLDAAERALAEGLAELERAELEPDERHFLTGFLLNGLAYVRFKQGNPDEATHLSHANSERLERHLPAGRHLLHRSVLLYNAGQVYAQTGHHDEALRHLSEAIELDPHHSEYFNDRGNLYLKLGRLAEAESDYLRAIELSPPYPEVWFNLGQCRAKMKRGADAEAAFERAVDLDPGRAEAWANLARLRHARGVLRDALAAYDAAVAAGDPNPFVLANRAAVRFEVGLVEEAAADLDRALELAPDNAALQRNRAVVAEAVLRRGDGARASEPAFA